MRPPSAVLSRSQLVLHDEAGHAAELPGGVGHEDQIPGQGVAGDQRGMGANRRPGDRQGVADEAGLTGGGGSGTAPRICEPSAANLRGNHRESASSWDDGVVIDALFPRFARPVVETALADTPVVVIQGARQVGKSTLAAQVAADRGAAVVSLDDVNTLRLAQDDPVGFIGQWADGLVVIDEAQRAPELILPLKASVDRDRRPGRFLLTGSADLLQVRGVGDSLAGRAETIELGPLSQGELARRTTPEDFVTWLAAGAEPRPGVPLDPEAVIRGGYPEPSRRSGARARAWFAGYVDRLAGHDAKDLHHGGYADQLRALLRLVAAQGQAELVAAKVARQLGIAETTTATYLRLATAMRLVLQFPGWNRSARGRVVGRPKVCLADTGLAAALTGLTAPKAAGPGGREHYGALAEQLVALELSKQRAWTQTPFDLYHFRHRDGLEVDLIAETLDGSLIAIEVKSTQTITPGLWANLAAFRDRFPDRRVTGVLLHSGDSVATLHGWLHVLPITALWQV